ncbi:MAG: acylphosphatase [Flavobacteriales bacterium]
MIINAMISVKGRVQGVGYRNFVHMAANVLGVRGWVRNELDGTVSAEIEGQQAVIDEMIEKCYQGSTLSRVDKIEIRQGTIKNHKDFKVIRL